MAGQHFAVTAVDGQEKRIMWGGQEVVLPAGDTRVFPQHLGLKFQNDHTITDDKTGERKCLVSLAVADAPRDMGMSTGSAVIALPCPWDGCVQTCTTEEALRAHHRAEHMLPLARRLGKGDAVEGTLVEAEALRRDNDRLRAELLIKQPVVTKYPCPLAGCDFEATASEANWRSHIAAEHPHLTENAGAEPLGQHTCKECGQNCASAAGLAAHMRFQHRG